ncbi:hypothetical protein KCU88_g4612, partial [Aureobasidium melanogenum]
MIYDVAIIGAGPCGLAVASRLRESTPSALFTDDEHARYWKRFSKLETIESERKRNRRTEKKNNRTGSQSSNTSNDSEGTQNNSNASNSRSEEEEDDKGHDKSIIVLDAHSNEWMSAWKEKFRNLQIDHLRSPLFFHPDPRDRDGLLAFSHFSGRTPELEEIQNVVGREIKRFQFLAQARNGGSITPKYDKILRKHVASGAVTILTQTCITRGTWAESSQTWSLDITPPHPGFPDQIDHIVYATGVPPKIENVACMQEILERHPIKAINGLPCINNDLMWNDDVPLFLTGGLAGLRLGPGAGNLAGARQGAERIAWKIDELLEPDENETPNQTEMILDSMEEKKGRKLSSQQGNQGSQGWKLNRKSRLSMEQERSEFTGGFANQFQALATVEGY